jgi:iron complex transport system substrate-binding protein
VALLKRTRIPVVEFDVPPNDIASVRAQVREMAALLQERNRGEQLISDIDRRLAAIGPVDSMDRPRALVLNPNGYIAGPGTLVDEVFTRAGLDNVATHMDLGNSHEVSLETVASEGVDVLIVNANPDGPPARATELLHHPILAQLGPHTRIVVLPLRLWSCAGPGMVDAIEQLKAVADDIRARRAKR